jgi:hypothetical protein
MIHVHLLPDLAELIRFQEFGRYHPSPDHGVENVHFRLEVRNSKVPDLEDDNGVLGRDLLIAYQGGKYVPRMNVFMYIPLLVNESDSLQDGMGNHGKPFPAVDV